MRTAALLFFSIYFAIGFAMIASTVLEDRRLVDVLKRSGARALALVALGVLAGVATWPFQLAIARTRPDLIADMLARREDGIDELEELAVHEEAMRRIRPTLREQIAWWFRFRIALPIGRRVCARFGHRFRRAQCEEWICARHCVRCHAVEWSFAACATCGAGERRPLPAGRFP